MKRLIIALACAACAGLVSAQEAAPAAAPAPATPAAKAAPAPAAKLQPRRRMRRDSMRGGLHSPMRGRAVEAKPFGRLADGTEVMLYRLQSPNGLIIDVSDYGGRLVR